MIQQTVQNEHQLKVRGIPRDDFGALSSLMLADYIKCPIFISIVVPFFSRDHFNFRRLCGKFSSDMEFELELILYLPFFFRNKELCNCEIGKMAK